MTTFISSDQNSHLFIRLYHVVLHHACSGENRVSAIGEGVHVFGNAISV